MQGGWPEAPEEARRAECRLARGGARRGGGRREGAALYRQGELHRLRGDLGAAEAAYRAASRCGVEPQPGLALLRLAQGAHDAAASMYRARAEAVDVPARTRLLPAQVEILVARGDPAAMEAARELETIARTATGTSLVAAAAHAAAAAEPALGDPSRALPDLRRAARLWQLLGAPTRPPAHRTT